MSVYVVSDLAREDLKAVWRLIASDDPLTADRFLDLIYDKLELLSSSPRLGRSRDELAVDLRSFPLGNYLIFYRLRGEGIEVARFLSGKLDLPHLFEKGEES